jgi:spore coat protein U-like protein
MVRTVKYSANYQLLINQIPYVIGSRVPELRVPLMGGFLYRRIVASGWVLIFLLAVSASAQAQSCTVSMPAMAFGNVNVLPGTAVDTTTTLTVTCSGGSGNTRRICISIGAGSANDATSRQMNGPSANKAKYDLYSNSARTQLWGSWQTGYDTAGVQIDVAKSSTTNVTVYGRFLASQPTIVAGAYSSTLTANPFIQYDNQGAAVCPTGSKTASTSSSVTATVISSCNVSATNINFGSLGLLVANNDAQGTLTIQCNSTLPYTVSLNGGLSGATDPTQRKMSSAGIDVIYGLYRDSARSLPWGSTVGTNTASGTGTGLSQGQTVYGRIAPQTTPKPAAYSDTLIATVTY